MKHTPGPWTDRGGWAEYVIKGGNGETVAIVKWIGPWPKQQSANARLIAESPNLLELLMKLRRYDRDRDLWGINDEIDTAIAKATEAGTP